jgi:predicted DNA-binding transcriptional regulator AlpA
MSATTQRKPRSHESAPVDPILRPREIEDLTGMSWKTIARAKPEAIIRLGKRAVAMRRSDVLRQVNR